MKSFYQDVEGVAEMNLGIFSIWGIWDMLLTAIIVFVYWLYSEIYGNSLQSVFISGTIIWLSIFVIFWVATANMGLSEWNLLLITLPLSWLEMIIASWISSKLYMTGRFS